MTFHKCSIASRGLRTEKHADESATRAVRAEGLSRTPVHRYCRWLGRSERERPVRCEDAPIRGSLGCR